MESSFTVFSHPRDALVFGLRGIHPLGNNLCDAVRIQPRSPENSTNDVIADLPEDASGAAKRIKWRFTPLIDPISQGQMAPVFYTCHGAIQAIDGGDEKCSVAAFEERMRTHGRLLSFSHGGIMPAWDFFPLILSTFQKAMPNKTITMAHDNNEATVKIGVHNTITGALEAIYKSDKDKCRFGLVVLCIQ